MNPQENPDQRGLYSPRYEHDACGIAMLANIKGVPSHKVLTDALDALVHLSHRGGTGAELDTGDGAGILTQIPDAFFRKVCALEGMVLPAKGAYGVGMFFLSADAEKRNQTKKRFEQIVSDNGQTFIGWRKVPVNPSTLGMTSRACMPYICQAFIQKSADLKDETAFERRLYLIRKLAEKQLRYAKNARHADFYAASLSCRTIVYKGMLQARQVAELYLDLSDLNYMTAVALVHSRYSTNTFPSWERAHPNRYTIHNGEINTILGNQKRMNARQSNIETDLFGADVQNVFPIVNDDGSDSAMFDNALEFLLLTGRTLPHSAMMMIPEPWEKNTTLSDELRAFYEFHSHVMDAWDGPAAICATNGVQSLAMLDRNGLRPARYMVTSDDMLILASETGVLDIPAEKVLYKDRLRPGRMLLVDTVEGRVISDSEIKSKMASTYPYSRWISQLQVNMDTLPNPDGDLPTIDQPLWKLQKNFGYTYEQINDVIIPMAEKGIEPTAAMGADMPLAVLSDKPQLLYDYFHQLFAQVTNPPIDAIREEIVTSTRVYIGGEGNLIKPSPNSSRQIKLMQPIITNEELARIKAVDVEGFNPVTLSILYDIEEDGQGIEKAMQRIYAEIDKHFASGSSIFILSDRGVNEKRAAIPALLAVSGVQAYTIRKGIRTRLSILLESGEPTEVHHYALLIGYGCTAINPYLALATITDCVNTGLLKDDSAEHAQKMYIKANVKGIVKIMSKMGISTVQSYRGAQIFEAVGLNKTLIDEYFPETVSPIGGIGLEGVARENAMRHQAAFFDPRDEETLPAGSVMQWRRGEEYHLYNPETIYLLQQACWQDDYQIYKQYSEKLNGSEQKANLRSLLEIVSDQPPVPIEEVESVEEICKRFKTGAMSYGSLSQEAHECLAIAMNRIGGKSNSGEGGEDEARFELMPNGDNKCSAIKQVASGRFGVTSNYLVHAKELQIKMAQGAKPGEGGQLPGQKVYPWIAKTRHSTAGVGLISPPPHHDIYSIEDLAELIYDLKNANRQARVSVKLVSEAGVGTIAAGVAKGLSDLILISGFDGGTGASPRSSIKHAGLPWELGLAETHQTLMLNKLRSRVVLETDGKLMTAHDVAVATMLGAEEFGFATVPLITMGCIMMRVCNLDSCPAGIATQNPELRKRFKGKPEYVVSFMHFVAQELREIMAQTGFRTITDMVGRVDMLRKSGNLKNWKHEEIDLSPVLYAPDDYLSQPRFASEKQHNPLGTTLDEMTLDVLAQPAFEGKHRVVANLSIHNVNRAAGTILGSELTKRFGSNGMEDHSIHIYFDGSAGQSFGAFMSKGITFTLSGDANDYMGKGLSGGILCVRPPKTSKFVPEDNVIIGNVALYGATSGEAYVNGIAGERFCVRNSGALAVVEGVGDHGCEYMTGGRVVVLGKTGRNFAAGMSGGIAYVYDEDGNFKNLCNPEMVALEPLDDPEEEIQVKHMIQKHVGYTGSPLGQRMIDTWGTVAAKFVKVIPFEYKRYLLQQQEVRNHG
ncbi:MAG TPA: glutamate synthase large subunit [Candidatus Limiplasma sp.]|nr:glutamate synthase large subunit [Candidatus Limiplasma sp.]HRX08854.1 glutamate synthase large subunit [Candidatus Limiplasma sp.]